MPTKQGTEKQGKREETQTEKGVESGSDKSEIDVRDRNRT